MKKWIACMLVLAVCCSLFGCLAKTTAVERFLAATVKMDLSAMRAELIPDETTGSFYRKLQNASLRDEAVSALRDLYALVQYTIGETTTQNGGKQTVAVTLKAPDMERIRSLIDAQMMVSGDSPEKILGDMLEDGQISGNMMKEYTVSVTMTESDGDWKIPWGDKENADFAKALSLGEMIDFMD